MLPNTEIKQQEPTKQAPTTEADAPPSANEKKNVTYGFPDFITFLRHHMAHIENQLITSNNWVVLGGASEKHVPL